ncbi:DUF4334 domain-containing protein [Crocosphaera sp.]|uniref:DUF4334 domain-containing protein n=1 Tax=Crocosphaera sp. TaxID=2729996 RepID=UPI002606AB60|nr:DUF4334 domain-containing protein [Crocosphaera sp.]MDJ0582758.1 DUF4334 domain-containing protein [Crocosphaera sp.]
METLENYELIKKNGQTTTEKALQWFDELEPVNVDFMLGLWQGSGLHTNHPMDGLLEVSSWYGKEFVDSETVHPLLFSDKNQNIFKVAPNANSMKLVFKMSWLKNNSFKPLLMLTNELMKTEVSQARLRMMEYRGKVTATMVYDYLPINDSFRKIDENTVLGIMDYKIYPQPFFFILERK